MKVLKKYNVKKCSDCPFAEPTGEQLTSFHCLYNNMWLNFKDYIDEQCRISKDPFEIIIKV